MIPRLGDGNFLSTHFSKSSLYFVSLENDSPSRGRKRDRITLSIIVVYISLENDSPSRGRKHWD